MVYLNRDDRERIDKGEPPATLEELTYALSAVLDLFLMTTEGVNHQTITSAMGSLECAKLELYRRLGAPLAEQARADTGEVYMVTALEE